MDHDIRIAPDGGSEMAIVFKAQSVMADIFCRVDGFGHGPDAELFEHMLFGFAADIDQHLVEGFRDGLWRFRIEGMAILLGKGDEREQLFLIRGIVDAIGKGDRLFIDGDLDRKSVV